MKHNLNRIIADIHPIFYKDEEEFDYYYNSVFLNITETVGNISGLRVLRNIELTGGGEVHVVPTFESKVLKVEKTMSSDRNGSFTHIISNSMYRSGIYVLVTEYFVLQEILLKSDKSVTFSNNRDIIEEADKKDLEWLFRCGNIRDGDVNNSDDYYKYNNYGNNILFMRASGVKIIRQVRHMTHVLNIIRYLSLRCLVHCQMIIMYINSNQS